MPRIEAANPETATGKAKALLEGIQLKMGMTPNILRAMANSPAALEAYLGFSGALRKGVLSPKLREQIALVVSEANECNYCLAAHTALGQMVGLSEEEAQDSRQAFSPDSKVAAALWFARQLVDKRGRVSDEDIARLRSAGYGDAEIAEIVAHVGLIAFTNYFNHVAETVVDFPLVPKLASR
jgi:uncharacterized peroxidase-related enzyme